jgi:hypothetical protein
MVWYYNKKISSDLSFLFFSWDVYLKKCIKLYKYFPPMIHKQREREIYFEVDKGKNHEGCHFYKLLLLNWQFYYVGLIIMHR